MRSPEPTRTVTLDLALPRGTACALVRAAELLDDRGREGYADLAREVAYQIRQQIGPPKPPEPTGWGAVVEASNGWYWTLVAPHSQKWANYGIRGYANYSEIDAVRVLSEGVTDAT